MHPISRRLLPLLVALPLAGCAVVTVGAAVAGAAITVTGAVVGTGVELTGKAIGAGIDAMRDEGGDRDGSGIEVKETVRPAAAAASAAAPATAASAAAATDTAASRPAGAPGA